MGRPRAACTHPGPCDVRTYRKGGRWFATCRIRATEYERRRLERTGPGLDLSRMQSIHVMLRLTDNVSEIARATGADRGTVRYHRDGHCRCAARRSA